MRIIPMTLRIENAEPDSWVTINFDTPDVEWSIGSMGRDSLGFSCNGKDLLRSEETSFKSIEIVGPSLVLRTAPNVGSMPFVLTLCVVVPDAIDLIEAHCDVNDDANIYFQFENFESQIWRGGRVSAVVPPVLRNIRKVDLCLRGVRAGKRVRVSLKPGDDKRPMFWSFGPEAVSPDLSQQTKKLLQGVAVRTEDGSPLPLYSLKIGATEVELVLAGGDGAGGGNAPDIVVIEAYVLCLGDGTTDAAEQSEKVLLKVDCDDDVSVIAQCGYQQPRYLTSIYKHFEF